MIESPCALPHRLVCRSGHLTRLKLGHRPSPHASSPFRCPETQRLDEVTWHCTRRAFGKLTSSPGAPHNDASRHMSSSLTFRVHTFSVVNLLRSSILFRDDVLDRRRRAVTSSVTSGELTRCTARSRHHMRELVVEKRKMRDGIVSVTTRRSERWRRTSSARDHERHRRARRRAQRGFPTGTYTASTSGWATVDGPGPARNDRPSSLVPPARERHPPWSSLIFCSPRARSSRPRPNPM